MVKFRSSALALFSLALIAAAASGQQYQQRQQYRTNQTQQRQPAATQYGQQPQYRQTQRTTDRAYGATTAEYGRTRASGADHKIAVLLANCNKAQIKLARYALDRAESSDVREFADALQQDHDITLRQLRRFAPEVASADSSSGRSYDQGERRGGEGRTIRAWDDSTVAQQISDRIVRKARDELSEKEGAEFDHCFVGQQLVVHQQDIAKMEVYRQYASPELRQVIDEAIQIAEGHEQEARELAENMRGSHRDRREEYAEGRDDSDWEDEGRIRRTSYEERSSASGDDEDRSYRHRDRDDSDHDEMEDDDRNREGRDDDEDEDDDDRRDDRREQDFRDRDR